MLKKRLLFLVKSVFVFSQTYCQKHATPAVSLSKPADGPGTSAKTKLDVITFLNYFAITLVAVKVNERAPLLSTVNTGWQLNSFNNYNPNYKLIANNACFSQEKFERAWQYFHQLLRVTVKF